GGYVKAGGRLTIGASASGTGTVTLTGTGSVLDVLNTNVSDAIFVGSSGSGELHVLDGGIANGARTIVGYTNGKTGVLTLDGAGSELSLSNYAMIGFNGTGTA